MKIKIKNLTDKPLNQIIKVGTDKSVGIDLTYQNLKEIEDIHSNVYLLGTGIEIDLEEGYYAEVHSRSSLALKKGISLVNSVGIIDTDYKGEIGIMIPFKDLPYIEKGERIAQLIIKKAIYPKIEEVKEISKTKRGKNGFGSTGK